MLNATWYPLLIAIAFNTVNSFKVLIMLKINLRSFKDNKSRNFGTPGLPLLDLWTDLIQVNITGLNFFIQRFYREPL